jgi:hypothetical protein
MRQEIKNRLYFEEYKKESNEIIEKTLKWIDDGVIVEENIPAAKRELASIYLKQLISCYTSDDTNINSHDVLITSIKCVNEGWDGFWKLKDKDGHEYDQYILSAYDEMLWMFSLGYLLDIDEKEFKKLVEVIDRDKVKDLLFEFIICAKIKDREPIQQESYRKYLGVPETFAKLREAIKEPERTKAEKLVKEFITKEWYKNHKDAGWYNSHKSKHNTYFGYWSFETAAIVKILGLNDTSFKECKYYPRDLVKEK